MAKRFLHTLNEIVSEELTPGEVVRSVRKSFQITQKELESITDIRETNLSAIENGKMEITKKNAEILGAALGLHPSTILFPNGYQKKSGKILAIEKKASRLLKKKMAAG